MNNLTIVGRLATDIRIETPKGKPIATFRVAIDRAGAEGADFIPVKCFGSAAENHARYLSKGRQVAIVGRLSQSQWTDEAGNRRERLEVIGVRVEYLGAPNGTAASDSDETGDAERRRSSQQLWERTGLGKSGPLPPC